MNTISTKYINIKILIKEMYAMFISLQTSVRRTGWSVTLGVDAPCRVTENLSARAERTKADVMVRHYLSITLDH